MAALSGPNPKAPGFAGDTYLGRRVHLNAVWVMFALVAFGYLFGFVGPLIAVPLAFAIGVLTRFALKTYYASSLYASTATKPPLKS